MNGTIQIGLGILAVVGATAMSRRGSSESFGAIRQKKCGVYLRKRTFTREDGSSRTFEKISLALPSIFPSEKDEMEFAKSYELSMALLRACKKGCRNRFPLWKKVGKKIQRVYSSEAQSVCIGSCEQIHGRSEHDWDRATAVSGKHGYAINHFRAVIDRVEPSIRNYQRPGVLALLRRQISKEWERFFPTAALSMRTIEALQEHGFQTYENRLVDPLVLPPGFEDSSYWVEPVMRKIEKDPKLEVVYQELATKFLHVEKAIVEVMNFSRSSQDLESRSVFRGEDVSDEYLENLRGFVNFLCEIGPRLEAISESCKESCLKPVPWNKIPLVDQDT